eukprot:scaffold23656_cov176-Cylindrotheca_fusiformis.AAC.2
MIKPAGNQSTKDAIWIKEWIASQVFDCSSRSRHSLAGWLPTLYCGYIRLRGTANATKGVAGAFFAYHPVFDSFDFHI